ncbi:MAG: HAD hydrolase-like protein [Oscillospiraceae bacterium]
MNKYDLVLFDFDGTLYNTFLGIARSCQNALLKVLNDYHENLHDFECCIGPPLRSCFTDIFGLCDEDADRAVKVFRERYNTKGVLECEPYVGTKDMLERIKAAGMKTAISSSKPEAMIHKILGGDGLTDEFDYIVGMKSESDHSTKTDAILEVISHYDMDKSRIVLVGDRVYDAEGAANVGIDFIAAMYGFGSDEEFIPYPCVYKAQTTKEVSDFIEGKETA